MKPHAPLNPTEHTRIARRTFLRRTGVGSVALASLLNPNLARNVLAESSHGEVSPTHFPPKIKRVIHLCMAGGPSHLETFDHKPDLKKYDGKPMPESITAGQPIAQLQGKKLVVRGPQLPFSPRGNSGLYMADVFKHIGEHADDMCIINSLHTEQINHDPAHTFFNSSDCLFKGAPGHWICGTPKATCMNVYWWLVPLVSRLISVPTPTDPAWDLL